MVAYEITQPNYHRNGVNGGSAAIVPGTILKRLTTEDHVDVATDPADAFAGVACEDMPIGIMRSVQVDGVAKVRTGGAFSVGAKLTADTTGRAVAASADTQNVIGFSLQASTGADEKVSVELTKAGSANSAAVFSRTLSITHEDLSDADTSQSFNLGAALPSGARPLGYRWQLDEAFVKDAQTFTGQIGIAGTLNKYADTLDIDGSTGETAAALGPVDAGSEQLLFTVNTNTGTLASSTAGEITVEFLFAVPG